MWHELTPRLILDEMAAGRRAGAMPGACLFLDITGFTPLTTALMQHGIEGAEVLAEVLGRLFAPLIEAVYAQGGFVAGFAGDAFKAVFPGRGRECTRRALAAARQIQRHLAGHPDQATRFGTFRFTGKVSVADGEITWRIWRAEASSEGAGGSTQRAAFMFGGSALDACMDADALAAPGDVIVSTAIAEALGDSDVTFVDHGTHRRVLTVPDSELPSPRRSEPASDGQTTAGAPAAADFYHDDLLASPLQGEFRQVVSIFANLPNPPAADEARFFDQLFALLSAYDGYLCRVGRVGGKDGGLTLLFFFGAPVSHENDLARALHFVLDLQAAAPTPLRAGVTAHMAFAGFVGSPRREEYTCHGNYVNLAARLMATAPPGTTWLDEVTAARAPGTFVLADAGCHRFKGFDAPLTVQALVGRRQEAEDPFYATPLIGRAQELAALHLALAPLTQGRFGGLVVVEGEPGMGKSRLAHAFAAQTRPLGVQWFLCPVDELLHQPLNPFRRWLQEYFGQATGNADERKARFGTQFEIVRAAIDDPVLAAELDRALSFLGALVDLYWEDSLYATLEPELRLENSYDAIKTLIKAESRRQPVVLHLEDTHWLDEQSRTLLDRLVRGVERYPFLLLATTRPPGEGTAELHLTGEFPQVSIRLESLHTGEIAAIVSERLGEAVAPALQRFVVERADGNPFFAEQLLFYLQELGVLETGPEGWQLAPAAATDSVLSGSMRAMLTARLDRLPLPVKLTVQAAAVLGREFDTPVLAHMVENDPKLGEHLVAADRAAMWSAMTATRYLFRHTLLREAAYEMQLRSQQRTRHRQAVAAIEAAYADPGPHYPALVHHSHLGEDLPRERRYAELAGNHAAEQFANADAVRFFSRALDLVPESGRAECVTLLLAREHAYHLLGNREAQRQDLNALLALAATSADSAAQVEVAVRRATFAVYVGELAEAETHARTALDLAVCAGDDALRARSYNELGRALWQQGRYAEARQALAQALASGAAATPRVRADSTYHLGIVAYLERHYAEAQEHFGAAHAAYSSIGDRRGEVLCLRMVGAVCYRRGDYQAARRHHGQGLDAAHAIGYRYGETLALQALGNTCYDLGDNEGARSYHTRAVSLARELGDREVMAISLDTLGLVEQRAGNWPQAEANFQEALQVQRAIGDRRSEAYTLTHLGALLRQAGRLTLAAEVLESALALRRELSEEGGIQDTLAEMALLSWRQGAGDAAAAQASAIVDWLANHDAAMLEDAVQTYLACYRVLAAAAAQKPAYRSQAEAARVAGQRLLAERAGLIQDEALRRAYLEAVPAHRAMVALQPLNQRNAEESA